MTQTSPKDFADAKRALKAAIKEEKRQQSMNRKPTSKNGCSGERKNVRRTKEENLHEKEKNRIALQKARAKYCQKRKKMEEKINRELL